MIGTNEQLSKQSNNTHPAHQSGDGDTLQLTESDQYLLNQIETVPLDEIQLRVNHKSTLAEMSAELIRIARLLAYAEYHNGIASGEDGRAKDHYQTVELLAIARMPGKMTVTDKRAIVLENDEMVRSARNAYNRAAFAAAAWKGTRDALRTSSDAISRMITVTQIELEMTRPQR